MLFIFGYINQIPNAKTIECGNNFVPDLLYKID